jgi:exosome complex component CSL4
MIRLINLPKMLPTENKGIPGDKLAVIEEFESGPGTFLDGDVIRASVLGDVVKDLQSRSIQVKSMKRRTIPKAGDIIIGQVEMAQGNIANVRILSLNDVTSQTGFMGLLLIKQNRGPRGRSATVCKLGDLIRAKVTNNLDMVITLTVDAPECGVIHASCSICGSNLININSRLKCVECGNVEFRKFAPDYDKVKL